MRFIGDTHAKFDRYVEIATQAEQSIQVGDFGIGFRSVPELSENHRFIRGNHDNPEMCRNHPRWIADGSQIDDMFFLGGGESIDRFSRTEGVDWWADEELEIGELYRVMDKYEAAKPRIMVSHECPSDLSARFFTHYVGRIHNPSRTSQALSSLLYIHRPEIWVFGHWHYRIDEVVDGTRFICLEELGFIDLE